MSPFEVVLCITHLLARLAPSLRAFSPGHSALLSQRDGFPTSSNDKAGDAKIDPLLSRAAVECGVAQQIRDPCSNGLREPRDS